MIRILFALLIGMLCATESLFAQSPPAPADSSLLQYIPGGMNIIVGKSLLLPIGKLDSVPLRPRSGTFFIGVGIKAPIRNPRWGLRFAPALAWRTYDYKQSGNKTFPTTDSTNIIERQRFSYVQAQLSGFFNLTLDARQKPLVWAEIGITPMYMINAVYIAKAKNADSQVETHKVNGLKDIQPLAINALGRVGYKSFALEWQWHTQPFVAEGSKGYRYPFMQYMELGAVILL